MTPDPPQHEAPQRMPCYARNPRRGGWSLGSKLVLAGLLVGVGSYGTCSLTLTPAIEGNVLQVVVFCITFAGVFVGGAILLVGIGISLVEWILGGGRGGTRNSPDGTAGGGG